MKTPPSIHIWQLPNVEGVGATVKTRKTELNWKSNPASPLSSFRPGGGSPLGGWRSAWRRAASRLGEPTPLTPHTHSTSYDGQQQNGVQDPP